MGIGAFTVRAVVERQAEDSVCYISTPDAPTATLFT